MMMIANDPVVCAVISSNFQQCCVGKTQCLTKKSLNKKLFTFRSQHPTHKCFHIFPLMTTSSTMIFLFTPHSPYDHQHSCDRYRHMTLTIFLNEKKIHFISLSMTFSASSHDDILKSSSDSK